MAGDSAAGAAEQVAAVVLQSASAERLIEPLQEERIISPDGRWVASAGEDNTLRLWPMPDLDKAPLHTLPHDELLARLKSLTNVHAVRDPKSSTDWSIELGPFPGWRNLPSW